MKFSTVFVVLCLVAYSTQSPDLNNCNVNEVTWFDKSSCVNVLCRLYRKGSIQMSAAQYIHRPEIIQVNVYSCSPPACEQGKKITGLNPVDEAAVYPGCCATPICE